MMLSVAYAASIGGIATLIGTTPNLIFAGIYRTFYAKQITFLQWASFGFPLAFFILIACWTYLVYVAYPPRIKVLGEGINEEIAKLGKITIQERRVLAVFLLVAALWITRALWGKYLPMITDSSIAILGAFLLFLIPAGKEEALLKWNDALRLPWDVVLLLGGGLAIAKGFTETGLDVWIANQLLFLKVMPAVVIILAVVTLTIFLTEITSNTATATIIIPVTASLAAARGIEPLGLMIAAAISASLAFMLPVATPHVKIIYSSIVLFNQMHGSHRSILIWSRNSGQACHGTLDTSLMSGASFMRELWGDRMKSKKYCPNITPARPQAQTLSQYQALSHIPLV